MGLLGKHGFAVKVWTFMIEKHWSNIAPVAFTATGTSRGRVTVTDTRGFRVKQRVVVGSTASLPSLVLEVKRVVSPTEMDLGSPEKPISDRTDLSLYSALTSFVYANEQQRPNISPQDIDRATYEEEPVVARRVIQVDEYGRPLKAGPNGEVQVSDALNGDSQGQGLTVSTVAVEAKGSSQVLSSRRGVFVYSFNLGVYLGFSPDVTPSNGIPIFQSQIAYIPAGSKLPIWLIRSSGSSEVRVWEVG